jgi:hypothetical protein
LASHGDEHRGLVAYACSLIYMLFSLLVIFWKVFVSMAQIFLVIVWNGSRWRKFQLHLWAL